MPGEKEGFSASVITQGVHKFYSLTMPIDVLAKTCFVSSRDEDPKEGFQRVLDKNKAQQIADYIDKQKGTIPTAVILSAQVEANLVFDTKKKTLKFDVIPKAFLVLDGQHRIYGFSLATSELRVPVIVYAGLSRKEESRLFIDINTKQRPVPNELLLDIKSLADYESTEEEYMRCVFDMFNDEPNSSMLGKLSASERAKNKLSRTTFNASMKPIYDVFKEREPEETYTILNAYLRVIITGFTKLGIENSLVNSYVFRAIVVIFPEVARLVKMKYDNYHIDNFAHALDYFFQSINPSRITRKLQGYKELSEYFQKCLRKDFTL
jgi:DGQHR domain-containing protein